MNTGMSLDTREFDRGLKKLANKMTGEIAEKGMTQAALLLLTDCIQETPTVPLRTGRLRGSGSVITNDILKGDSREHGKNGTPATAHKNKKGGFMTSTVGFNTTYAAKMHEHPEYRFREPSSGANYLLAKLQRYKKQYYEAVRDYFKKQL